ncbi:MAG: hypothetical protein IJ332_01760 [Clostridia bacterium]|nr:hypothetical protein [Clostridia bacterium]
MKKIISVFSIIAILLTSSFAVSASVQCEQVHYPMYFNGTLIPEGDKPILSLNWNTYVPLRKVCEGTGLTVDWNDQKQEIYVENTAALAAMDYAYLAEIYSNTTHIGELALSFHNNFLQALNAYQSNYGELAKTKAEAMFLDHELMEMEIETIKILISRLNGYYDGTTVTKATYDNIENLMRHNLILSLLCYDLIDDFNAYLEGKITLTGLYDASGEFLDSAKYAFSLIDSGNTGIGYLYSMGGHSTYYKYSEFQSMKPMLLGK